MKTLRAYIITRTLLTIPMLFVLVTLVFFVVRIMPGDPVEAMLRPGVPQEYKNQIKHNLGLDRPLFFNFRGSSAQVEADTLFLKSEAGGGGSKTFLLAKGDVLDISGRKDQDGDWLQLALPDDVSVWVSSDQLAWMRQVNTAMTIIEEKEIPGTETWTRLNFPEGPDGDRINAIWGDSTGLLLFGTENGVSRLSSIGWEFLDDSSGNSITCAWSEKPADFWFGTEANGLLRFRSNKWSAVTTADGLPSNHIYSIWGKGSRTLWVGTDKGAGLFDGKEWSVALPGRQVFAVWSDGKDTFWFGTDAGLEKLDGDTWSSYTQADGVPNDHVNALWGDESGNLWVGTNNGLGKFDGESWTSYTSGNGLAGNQINVIRSDQAGDIWCGTENGISSFDGESWKSSSTEGLADPNIRSMWFDNTGELWIGTANGLNQFDSRPWIHLNVSEGGMEGWAVADQFEIRVNPFDSQYFNYLWDLVHLNFGVSMAPTRGRPVADDLKLKFPATLELAIASLLVTVLIGVSTGAYAAHKRRSVADYGFRIFSIVIWAVPVFWLGIMFQLVFGVYLGDWYETSTFAQQYVQPIFKSFLPLPISGRIGNELTPRTITGLFVLDSLLTGNRASLTSALRYLILPAFTLGLYLSGVFTRLTRSNMLDVLREDFITAARARGIKERVVVYNYALKNAFIPILTMMGLQFAALLAGAVLTETTFSWPGMGLFMWERIGYRDFNSIQGSVVFFAVLVAAVSLLVDIIYAWIDPRIRY